MADDPFIKSIAKIAYAEDSSRAIVTFTTDNGVVTYQFSIFDLQTIVGAMSQMVLFAQSQTLSRGYSPISATERAKNVNKPGRGKHREAVALADVRYGTHFGLMLDIAPLPRRVKRRLQCPICR